MNGPIAQCVALVCHANAVLGGKRGLYFQGNSTARFCHRIEFAEQAPDGKVTLLAENPDAWFVYLARSGVAGCASRVRRRAAPLASDRMSAGFVGGGEVWTIEAARPDGQAESWQAYWNVWNRKAPEQRIWRVTYARGAPSAPGEADSLPAARAELAAALDEIHAFAERNQCGGFVEAFAEARSVLAGTKGAKRGFHRDLAPEGMLGSDALAMLDACQHASVFGGMGSWNDQSFDGAEGEAYERVSERLFRAVNRAIAAAANDPARRS